MYTRHIIGRVQLAFHREAKNEIIKTNNIIFYFNTRKITTMFVLPESVNNNNNRVFFYCLL